ncbi:MAG TPA: hypothetical protein VMT67_15355 [Terriglobales bacterium]|nr:hypothetical protein [Terriglobales bacterium]
MSLSSLFRAVPRSCSSVLFAVGARPLPLGRSVRTLAALAPPAFLVLNTREEVYNILWVLVFGFATLNIVSLGARRFEAQKRGLNFGEVLAIMIVFISIVLLGWEMLYVFHILPIRLEPR